MNRTVAGAAVALSIFFASGGPGQAQAPTIEHAPRIQMPRQGPSLPPRDASGRPAAPPPAIGTASMSGRVVAADSGEPLRRATVSAMPMRPPDPQPGGFVSPPRPISARTDDDGRFTIRQLPAGEYHVTARRSGYVEQGYGQITPNTPPRRITVADGAALGPLDFQLIRGGVITGRVVDETGEPAERVQVRAMRAQRAGQGRFFGGMGDSTDDQGHYRLFGLAPGEYLVVAEPGGRGFFMGGQNVQGVDMDTIPTYGPATVNPAEAQKVLVQAGVDASMDIQLVSARVAKVSGRVVDSRGQPLTSTMVRLQPAGGDYMSMSKGGPVMADGQYEIDAVAPGTYTIIAQQMRGGMGPDDEGPMPEMAMQTITVEGEDLVVPLQTAPGSTARGRVIVEGADPATFAARSPRIMSFPTGQMSMFGMPGRGKVNADLTFEMQGLRGSQVLSMQMLPEGWWLKDVRVSGQTAVEGFDWGQGRAFTNVEVVVSARPTGLTGTVTMPTGSTANDYAVVLFPEDESRWEPQQRPGPMTGARVVRPGLDGAFKLQGVRPGTYYVAAVPAAQADMQALQEADQLRALAGRARTVEVKDGELSPVTLTLVER